VPLATNPERVRIVDGSVGPAFHNANHEALVDGPAIALTPHNVRLRSERGSTLRDEVLSAVARIGARTGVETVLRGEVVRAVLSSAPAFQEQSVYKALRRMSGREVGAAVDLEDLGDGLLRLRPQHRR
jgi:hypothetical protein